MINYRNSFILHILVFLIPLNIYMWGDWMIVDLQWAFFRFQSSPYGDSLIPVNKDISYILLGQTTGIHPVLASLFWAAGGILLIVGLLALIFCYLDNRSDLVRKVSFFTIAAGIFFGLSAIERFAGGFAIPVGVPIVLFIGWWMYQKNVEPEETDDEPGDEKTAPEE
jgi:hypothetical protein